MNETAYIAIDLHSKNSVLGHMDQTGKYLNQYAIKTSPSQLISKVVAIDAGRKVLTMEQGNMSHWAASILHPYVDELIVCDPRHNRWVSGGNHKNDEIDTYKLCELLRLGSVKALYYDSEMGKRRLFLHQIREFQRLNRTLVAQKRQLRSALHHWGYQWEVTKAMYQKPDQLTACIGDEAFGREAAEKMQLITVLQAGKDQAFERAVENGKDFWEIAQFERLPGIGPVGAHVFSAYIQTPHRFANKRQLLSFCKLGVVHHSSNGRKLRAERLSKAGHGCLKELSHRAWKACVAGDNEVNHFYQQSLKRCGGNADKARLNTQRKILKTLWALWKNKQPYRPELFLVNHGVSIR